MAWGSRSVWSTAWRHFAALGLLLWSATEAVGHQSIVEVTVSQLWQAHCASAFDLRPPPLQSLLQLVEVAATLN